MDGEELGSEKLKALVEKFKHDVEQQGNDDDDKDNRNLSIEDDSDDDDDDDDDESEDESTTETAPPRAVATTRAAVVATNEQVRSKFINRLGIQSSVVPPEANPRRAAIPREPSYELPLNDAADFEDSNYYWDKRKLIRRNPFSFFSQKSSATESVESTSSVSGEAKEEDNNNNNNNNNNTTTLVDNNNNNNNAAMASLTLNGGCTQGDDETTGVATPPKGVRFDTTVKAHPIPSHTVYSKRMKQTIWSSAQELEENVARNCYEFEAENWNFDDVADDEDMIWYHGQWVHPVHFADFSSSNHHHPSLSSDTGDAGQ